MFIDLKERRGGLPWGTYNLSVFKISVPRRKKKKNSRLWFIASAPLPNPFQKKTGISFFCCWAQSFFICLIFQQNAERYEYKSKSTHFSIFLGSDLFPFYNFTPSVPEAKGITSLFFPFSWCKVQKTLPPPFSSCKSIHITYLFCSSHRSNLTEIPR